MKFKLLLIPLIAAFFLLTGCLIPYAHSFSENESQTAEIWFENQCRILFVDLEGQTVEVPEKSYLNVIKVPAGRQMDLRVYVYWDGPREGFRRRGIFKCPPLQAGGEYRLRHIFKTKGIFVKRYVDGASIVLERKTEVRGVFGTSRQQYENVYTQEIPPWSR